MKQHRSWIGAGSLPPSTAHLQHRFSPGRAPVGYGNDPLEEACTVWSCPLTLQEAGENHCTPRSTASNIYRDECLAGIQQVDPDAGHTFHKYELPGRTRVNTQAWTFHYDPTIFPDPEKFDPDRWRHPAPQMQEDFMPFGAGARICIGIQLAKMELLHSTFAFFKACPKAVAISTEADMAPVDYFLIKPKSQECLITLGQF